MHSAESRIGLFYALMFGSVGATLPFAAVWFDSLGISSSMIGVIFAAPSLLMVLTTVLLGSWADRLADWRTAIIVCCWVSLGLFSILLLDQGPLTILVVWTLAGIVSMATVPITDAASLSFTRRRGSDYGRLRSMGTLGFVVTVVMAGAVYERLGIEVYVAVLLAVVLLRTLGAHTLPALRGTSANAAIDPVNLKLLSHPGFLLVLGGAALINASHAFFYSFGILHWTSVGISQTLAAVLWSIGGIAEAALMWVFRDVARQWSARKCLLIAAAVAAVRWIVTSTEPGMPVLMAAQALHGVTFGLMFLATVNFISRRAKDSIAARAQALSATLATATMAFGNMLCGWLYDHIGVGTYWVMVVVALAGGLLIAASYRTDLDEAYSV